MSPRPARFTFDLDLGRGDRGPSPGDATHAARLEAARAEGREAGFAEGERSAASKAARQLAASVEALAQRAAQLVAAQDETRRALLGEATGLAAVVAKKLAAGLVEREPEGALLSLVERCLASLDGVPHLVIRCHPDLVEKLQAGAEPRLAAAGFAGRLVVVGEPQLRLGDGRVEWADGGLVRDQSALSEHIDRTIAAYLAVSGRNAEERQA